MAPAHYCFGVLVGSCNSEERLITSFTGGIVVAGETALPCRHPGAPPDDIINLVAAAVKGMASNAPFLQQHGLTSEDFELALPAAIQRIRGSAAASNADRRAFLIALFNRMSAEGAIESFDLPDYGNDTIYRLRIGGIGSVAIIQKGCPDGAHSSVNWSAPAWADETYLWWLCDSLQYEPGEHVAKGVNRLRNRFFSSEYTDAVDGIIFHNATCGTSSRPCPKASRSIDIAGKMVPPPCIDIMPDRAGFQDPSHNDWNWDGERVRRFPEVLLSTFGIGVDEVPLFTGQVGFLKSTRGTRTRISSRYGPGRSTNFRSDPR